MYALSHVIPLNITHHKKILIGTYIKDQDISLLIEPLHVRHFYKLILTYLFYLFLIHNLLFIKLKKMNIITQNSQTYNQTLNLTSTNLAKKKMEPKLK